ncbi:MAG: PAS domain S-box protein [Promethearchaeota archaeon]
MISIERVKNNHLQNLVSFPISIILVNKAGIILKLNNAAKELFGYLNKDLKNKSFTEITAKPKEFQLWFEISYQQLKKGDSIDQIEIQVYTKSNNLIWISIDLSLEQLSENPGIQIICQEITHLKAMKEELEQIKWIFNSTSIKENKYQPLYGDLATLNTECIIFNSIKKQILLDIIGDFLDLLETSAALYEKNGDYVISIFSSHWCQFLDQASRNLYETADNKKALESGKWLCHESCWTHASKVSIETGRPVDIECSGGLRIYAVPIFGDNETIGSINFGYGVPPKDPQQLRNIAERYKVKLDQLLEQAEAYQTRPSLIIKIAKKRLLNSARIIGKLVECKRIEEKIKNERDINQKFLDIAGGIIVAINLEGKIEFINKKGCEILGYSIDKLIGRDWFENFLPLPQRNDAIHIFKEIIAEKRDLIKSVENVIVTKSGDLRTIAWHHTLLRDDTGKITAIISSGTDITAHKQTEEAIYKARSELESRIKEFIGKFRKDIVERKKVREQIAEIKEFYKGILDGIINGVWVTDKDDIINYCNRKMEIITGIPSKQIIDAHVLANFSEETLKDFKPHYLKAKNTLKDVKYDSISVINPASRQSYQSWYLVPLVKNGSFDGMICTVDDITERKQISDKLIETNLMFQTIFEDSLNPIMVINENGQYIDANEAALEFLECDKQELFNKVVWDYMPPNMLKRQKEEYIPFIKRRSLEADYLVNGKIKTLLLNVIPVTFPNEVHFYSIGQDITDQKIYLQDLEEQVNLKSLELQKETKQLQSILVNLKSTQEQLVQSEKLASIGLLAAGIAHEINNPIMGIINYAQIVKDELENYKNIDLTIKPFSFIDGIIKEGERISKIIEHLLTFAREEKGKFVHAAISEVINSSLALLFSKLRSFQISIHLQYDEKLPKISMKKQNIQQVILNILQNSIDALNEKFKITSEKKLKIIKIKTSLVTRQKQKYGKITITDNGQGIQKKNMKKLFDPFFTTKEKSKDHGVGLGLSVSYGIVKDHDGKISFRSKWKKYTTVTILLPIIPKSNN